MPNHGQKTLCVKTPSGKLMTLTSQVVSCTGSLTSVAKLIDVGHFVGFYFGGSFIMNMATGEFERLERVNDCFELELEVVPYEEAKPLLKTSGF